MDFLLCKTYSNPFLSLYFKWKRVLFKKLLMCFCNFRPLSFIGLTLIGIGTGGIKPCVATFGGEQFVMPYQKKPMTQFFSLFYAAVNCGSLTSVLVTPILRSAITCFGQDSCYPLAFGVPAALMAIAVGKLVRY